MRKTWVLSLGGEDPLEKEMTAQFSTLAWRIPWTEEAGGLQSMGSQRVRVQLSTQLFFQCGNTHNIKLTILAFFFFFHCFLNWRLIALQRCDGRSGHLKVYGSAASSTVAGSTVVTAIRLQDGNFLIFLD